MSAADVAAAMGSNVADKLRSARISTTARLMADDPANARMRKP